MMQITYKKLWKMLIDRDMSKQQLKGAAGISSASIAKLGKGENITTDVLLKICEALMTTTKAEEADLQEAIKRAIRNGDTLLGSNSNPIMYKYST